MTASKLSRRQKSILSHPGVYFLWCPGAQAVKIGYSGRSMIRRMFDIHAASPLPLHPIGAIKGATLDHERGLHERLAHLRSHREWFRIEEDSLHWFEPYLLPGVTVAATDPPTFSPLLPCTSNL